MNTTPDRFVIHDMTDPMGEDWGFFVHDTEAFVDLARCVTRRHAERICRCLNLLNAAIGPVDHTS